VTCLSFETCACKSKCMFARTRYASGSPFTARAGFKFLPFMEWSFELLAFEIFARHRYALLNVTLWRAEAVEHLNEKNALSSLPRLMLFSFLSCQHLESRMFLGCDGELAEFLWHHTSDVWQPSAVYVFCMCFCYIRLQLRLAATSFGSSLCPAASSFAT